MAGVAYSAALLSCRRVFLASRALAQYQTRFVPLKHHRFPAVRSPIVNWSCRWFGCINVFGEELSSGEAQKLLLDMKQEDGYLKHTPNEELLAKIMRAFMVSSFVVERAKELGVAPQEVPAVTQRLREKIRNNSKGRDQLVNHLKMAMQTGGEAAAIEQVLWPLFVQVAYNDFPQFSEAMNEATHLNQVPTTLWSMCDAIGRGVVADSCSKTLFC